MVFKKKIVIINVHWNKRDDKAALKGLWINLKKKFPSHEITTVFKDKNPILDNLKNYTDKVVVNRFKEPLLKILIYILFRGRFFKNEEISKLVKILINADLVVYGPGGSVISDNFYKYKQIEYLTPFMICYFFKIPFFVLGSSFGPFDHKKKFFLRNFLLKKTNNFCVREGISKSYVEEITKKNVKTYRAAVRTKSNEMCTKIDAVSDVDALAALYEYSGDPLVRPLGEFPVL